MIERVRAQGGKVQGGFEFGSMPSEKKRQEFHELRAAFKSVTGAELTTDDFLARAEEEEGETLPNFNFIPAVTDEMSMLAVEHYFVQAPERTIRPIALQRKNALFAGHDAGAQNWAVIASLIAEPHSYLTGVLTAIVNGHKQKDIEQLLPWNFQG